MWRVAGPSEYLAITGVFIKDVKLAKKAWIWPTQKCITFHVSPANYTFEMWGMSAEKLPLFLSLTIGPCVTNHKSLLLYAKLIASHVKPWSLVKNLVQGLVAASLTMERMELHILKEFLEKLQLELKQFGLVIYKVNLADTTKAKIKGKVGAVETKQNAVKTDLDTKAKMKDKVGAGQTKRVRFNLETNAEMKGKVGAGEIKQNAMKTDLYTKSKMKGKVGAGQTKHVRFNLETNAKMKGNVGAGETKQNAVKTDLEKMKGKVGAGQTKQNAVKTNLQTKIIASELAKVQEANCQLYRNKRGEGQKATADAILYAPTRISISVSWACGRTGKQLREGPVRYGGGMCCLALLFSLFACLYVFFCWTNKTCHAVSP